VNEQQEPITIQRFFDVEVLVSISLTNPPSDWMSRCFTPEWRDHFYRFDDERDVYAHLGFNALVNDVDDISRLEGWADIKEGAIRIQAFSGEWEAQS